MAVVVASVMRRLSAMSSRCRHDRSGECDTCEERDDQFLLHNTPSFLFWGLVNESANDAPDDCRAEDGPAVRLMVFDVNDLVVGRRGRRRGSLRTRSGRRVVRRCGCAMMRDFMSVRRGFLMATTLCGLRGWGFLLLLGGNWSLAATRGGSGQSRAANRNTRESRDCHLDDLLVHVTPTFLGFLP